MATWSPLGTLGVGGGGAAAGKAPLYGWVYNPVTARLTLETVQPDSGEVFQNSKYTETFVGLGTVNFSWSTTQPTHLIMGLT